MKLQQGNYSLCFDSFAALYWFIDRVGKSFADMYKHFSIIA